MVSGPEHYKLAEELVGYVKESGEDFTPEGRADAIALAQVHATLANAAATALAAEVCGDVAGVTYRAFDEWGAATAAGEAAG